MAEETRAQARAVDFTNTKDGGGMFNRRRQPAGDYRGKVTKVVDAPSKKDGADQYCFTIQVGTGTYPYYCKLVENQLWKLRNLLMAAGLNVPKKRVKVDPNKIVGREIGVTLDDDDYENDETGKVTKQSQITAVMPASELDPSSVADDEDEDEDDEEDEDDTPPPPKKKAKPAPVEDDDDDDDDDDEDDTPPPPKKKSKPAPEPEEDDDDDDDDEEEEPAPKKKAKKKAKPVEDDDDELDELDIDL